MQYQESMIVSSFDLFFTPDTTQFLQMTNLHRRRSVSGWSDVDAQEIQAYMGLLILTAPMPLLPAAPLEGEVCAEG